MNLLRLLFRADPAKVALSFALCSIAPAFVVMAFLMGSGPLAFTHSLGRYATYAFAVLALAINGLLQSAAMRHFGTDFRDAIARTRANVVRLVSTSEVKVVRSVGATEIASIVDGDGRLLAASGPAFAVITVSFFWCVFTLIVAAHESLTAAGVYLGGVLVAYFVRVRWGKTESAELGDAAEARFRGAFADLLASPRTVIGDRRRAAALAKAIAVEAKEAARQRNIGGVRFFRSRAWMELVLDFAVLATHELANGVVAGVHVSDELMILLVCSLSPFTRVVNSRFKLEAAARAARRLLSLEAGLRAAPRARAAEASKAFEEIRFESVTALQAARPGEKPFALGPLDLTIKRGSVTVVHGENGSGKSTFLDVVLGLLRPQTGQIFFDGNAIDSRSIDSYRQLFSLVYAHPHLFDRLYGHDGTRKEAQDRLAWLGLGEIQADAPHRVSGDLSTGQQKRLALARALAENRPVLVLDEYTADQDPAAREAFHNEILPRLKAEGRTVIAVLHGSSTPACADAVVRLERGRMRMTPDDEATRAAEVTRS